MSTIDTTARSAMKLALEALNTTESDCGSRAWEREQEAITALREALAQERSSDEQPAQQEPVGYVAENGVVDWNVCPPPIMTDIYTSPQPAPVQQSAERVEPVAFALRHKNGLEFNSNYPMVKTLEEAEDLKRRHFGEVKIAALYTTPPNVATPLAAITQEELQDLKRSELEGWRYADELEQERKRLTAQWQWTDIDIDKLSILAGFDPSHKVELGLVRSIVRTILRGEE